MIMPVIRMNLKKLPLQKKKKKKKSYRCFKKLANSNFMKKNLFVILNYGNENIVWNLFKFFQVCLN